MAKEDDNEDHDDDGENYYDVSTDEECDEVKDDEKK